MKNYPTYKLTGPVWKRPDDLHRHLARYQVACTVRSSVVCTDGSHRDYWYRASTGREGTHLGGLLAHGFTRVTGQLTALALRAINWRAGLGRAQPVRTEVHVRLLVSPLLGADAWAELLLCKYAARGGWTIRPADGRRWIDPHNLSMARKDPRTPALYTKWGDSGAGRRSWA